MPDPTIKSLFGESIPATRPRPRRRNEDRAHAEAPGSGPAGETCGTCQHLACRRLSRRYYKCALMRYYWTGGYGTDVHRKDAACAKWATNEEGALYRYDERPYHGWEWYPVGTKAFTSDGGYWLRTEWGWQWHASDGCVGCTAPSPWPEPLGGTIRLPPGYVVRKGE